MDYNERIKGNCTLNNVLFSNWKSWELRLRNEIRYDRSIVRGILFVLCHTSGKFRDWLTNDYLISSKLTIICEIAKKLQRSWETLEKLKQGRWRWPGWWHIELFSRFSASSFFFLLFLLPMTLGARARASAMVRWAVWWVWVACRVVVPVAQPPPLALPDQARKPSNQEDVVRWKASYSSMGSNSPEPSGAWNRKFVLLHFDFELHRSLGKAKKNQGGGSNECVVC